MTEPRWTTLARADLGIREVPGIANNPLIVRRLAAIPRLIGFVYNADSIPWCGAMMAWWMNQCGIKPPALAARAMSWAKWGRGLKLSELSIGAILVFQRLGGGHVAQYVGEDKTHYHCLGANQGDAISIVRIEKARCVAWRWPEGEPLGKGPVQLSAAGARVSTGEA